MPGFMNAELESIRCTLQCGHCGSVFSGSDSQARKVKYESLTVYCSGACRYAALRNKFMKPIPNRGPCKTCGNEFFSRTSKIYCSLKCYVKSEQFALMLATNREKNSSTEIRNKIADTLRTGQMVNCLECGHEFYQRQKRPRTFCATVCYRSYFAKRFDRWIANPEEMALPQCYDEFLDREELQCIVDGCDWKGLHLTTHVNSAHGLKADDFKRAAGFNLRTGVIARPLAEVLQARENVGVALNPSNEAAAELGRAVLATLSMRYMSREGIEHRKKARSMMLGPGPERRCAGCDVVFQQTSPFGRALYCSIECRDSTYRERLRVKNPKHRVRQPDGTFKWESASQ